MRKTSGQPARTEAVRSIRVSEEEVTALLDRLDSEDAHLCEATEQITWYRYRIPGCTIHLQQPGDAEKATYSAPTRTLHKQHLRFIHGGFVHPGSRCLAQLISQHGSWENVQATVSECTHLQGAMHEIEIRFDYEIDPSMFCSEAVKLRVLLAEDDPAMVRLANSYLRGLNAIVTVAENGEQTVELASQNMYDLILMDIEMPVLGGLEATERLRSQGYSGKIVAATALTGPAHRDRCLEAGCDDYVPKPYTRDQLATLLQNLKEEPLISSMAADAGMKDLINEYVAELPKLLHTLEEAFANEDLDALASAARRVKGQAGSYGFEPISESAAKLETAVQDAQPTELIKSQIDDLAKLCQLARGIGESSQYV